MYAGPPPPVPLPEVPTPPVSPPAQTTSGLKTKFRKAEGRDHFETKAGMSIVGARPLNAFLPGEQVSGGNLFEEQGAWHVRGKEGVASSVVIELEQDRWAAAAILPGFIGTLNVGSSGVDHVSYMPATGTWFRNQDLFAASPISPSFGGSTEDQILDWTRDLLAEAGVAIQAGAFEVAAADGTRAGDYLRRFKHRNPTLGIYAAYAYDRAGRRDQVVDMLRHFELVGQTIPYDILLLAGLTTVWNPPNVAPNYPLLTQGWAYLNPDRMHPILVKARQWLAPSSWATVLGDAGRELAHAVRNGGL